MVTAVSTWTWVGASSTAWTDPGNWTLASSDAGNANNYPAPGDTAIVDTTTPNMLTVTGAQLNTNTIDLSGGASIDFANGSTLDAGSVVNGQTGTVDVTGVFTDLGTIQTATSVSVLTVSINGTLISNGLPNDVGLNDGAAGTLGNGTLVVTGGTVESECIHINGGV